MISLRKALKKDKPMLIEYQLLTITPYLKKNEEKLNRISEVSNFISDHYSEYRIISYFLKPIGTYLVKDGRLEIFYIKEEYEKLKLKVLNKILKEVKEIAIRKEQAKEIEYLKQKGWKKIKEEKEYLVLRKDDQFENK